MNHTYILQSGTDFFAAALCQARVSVWLILPESEQLMDYGGVVEAYSDLSVKIAGSRYFRDKFEFRMQVK